MQIDSPFDALHEAISAATLRDLPDIQYWQRDWTVYRALSKKDPNLRFDDGKGPGEWVARRPMSDEVRVSMFPETWSSTALGYGGIGGASMTPAYTVIVSCHNMSCVYFGCGQLAYLIDHRTQSKEGRAALTADINGRHMARCGEERKYK